MRGADFLDANVFIYSVDAADPTKQLIAQRLLEVALADGTAVTSWQVVQETMHVLRHRFRKTIGRDAAQVMLQQVLAPLWTVMPSESLYLAALDVQERYGFAWYDSLVVAAAREAGCARLLTEDLQHGQRFGNLRIENPFRS